MEDEEKNKFQETEPQSSSDYWADVVRGKYDEDDEEEVDENASSIFHCLNCGFMYDISNPPKYLHPFGYYIASQDPLTIKCPNCHKKVLFSTATKEEYQKYLDKKEEKKKKEEDNKIKRLQERESRLIKEDLKDLAEDLKDRLVSKEITPKRFVALFTNLSRNIVKKYSKNLEIDWLDFRKTIFELSDGILKVYKSQEKTEQILEEYDQNIEDDELYLAEMGYFIEDNKFSIPDYELNQRMREYDRQDAIIKKEEYQREIEEKYQERKNKLLQKAEERERRKKLRDIM